jgi:Carboxypeptidase regulatory-like domain/TonB dependent receptor/TonB-dependent Receptor Plug Domain
MCKSGRYGRDNVREVTFLLILSLLFVVPVSAQSSSATINGIVLDPSGAAIAGAQVVVVNDLTGVQYTTRTNGEGIYVVPNLPPGPYRVQVSNSGFKTIIKPDIVIHVQDALAINFTLPIGAASEIVTVEGGAPLVNTESASVSTVIDRDFAEKLPLNGRSFNTLLQLTPGITIVPSSATRPGQFSINGQRTDANSFQVDGVSVNFGNAAFPNLAQAGGGGSQAFNAYGGTSSLVSADALQEFRVETSGYAPEFGRTPGGQVIISTRSGTNQFHGTVFDYFRNDVLDANDWFANAAGKPRAPERQNDFGGVFGGPIHPEKTFFFFSYEGLRLKQPSAGIIQVPSLAWRASAVPAAAVILNAYPLPDPNAPVSPDGNASPFTGVWSNQITTDAVSLRVDHTFNSRLSAFARYNRSPSENLFRLLSLSTIKDQEINTTTITAGANWLILGTMSDVLRVNYSKQTAFGANHLDNFAGAAAPSPAALMPAGTSVNDSFATFNPVFLGNPLGSDLLASLDLGLDAKNQVGQWNVVDDLALTKGAHRLKFGIDFRRLSIAQTGLKSAINYLPVGPPVGPPNPSGQFASSATVSNVTNRVVNPANFNFRSFSAYAQDAWKIGQRISLTYGVRWELNPPPSPEDGTVLAAWQNADNLPQLAIAPAGTPLWKTSYGNFAPRIGIAWQVTRKGDLVVRGGWGMFYDLGTGPVANLGFDFPNVADFSSFFTGLGPFPVPITNQASITPSISFSGPYVNLSSLAGVSPNLQLPYSYQWNLAVEKALWSKQALTLTYLGQVGRRLLRTEAISNPNANFQNSSFLLTRNGDTSDFHALQAQFRRPLSQRLQALFNYTWSHSIDTNSDDTLGSISHLVLSLANERGSSNFDVRQQVSGAVTFDVPGYKRNAFFAMLSENWSLDGIFQARTGFPLNIFTTSVAIAGQAAGLTQTRPDLVPGIPIWITDGNAPGGKRLNPAAFVLPSTHRQGTLGRNRFAGFGSTQIDTSLGRKFALTERLNLQFRADVFNLFNHPNFSTADPFGRFPSANFGRATQMLNRGLGGLNSLYQIGGPRSLQLSLKLIF